ncbi:MAG: HypC/HybG/HupF family hydrogenase formation chaperone [Actinomycetota bacterium]
MCLGIPGRVLEIVDIDNGITKVDMGGVVRTISTAVLATDDPVAVGDWLLIHLGFALSKIDEEEAEDSLNFLRRLGDPGAHEPSVPGDGSGRRDVP